jgi:beta-glucanase (GH16 family)
MRGTRRLSAGYFWPAAALAPLIVVAVLGLIGSQPGRHGARFRLTAARSGVAGPHQTYHLAGHWRRVFQSEFTGTALNPAIWSTSRFGDGTIAPGFNASELECFDPARVSTGRHGLTLSIIRKRESCGGRSRPYSSGLVSSIGKYTFKYGLMEARIRVPHKGAAIANWPAVWADGKAELDLFEGGWSPCWYYHAHDGRRFGQCTPKHRFNFTKGWHTVAANWEPGSITWYYDHQQVARVTSHVTSAPMAIMFDLAVSDWGGSPVVVPSKFQISWVRVWKHVT